MPGPGEHVAEVVVAPVSSVDAGAMAAWINAFHWNPGPLGGAPLSAADYTAFVTERGAVETFVALAQGRVVGSLALYPVSALKAGQGSVVWMDTFAIDPGFRLGAVPIRLFVEAFAYCVAHGYDRVDCNASPANPSMVAIVRPGGFRQASTEPCGDDRLEFRSHLPYLYRFVIEALGLGARVAELARVWTDFGSSPWVPGRAPRNAAEDVGDYHGAPTFRYSMVGSGAESVFVVDLAHDRVCALNWDGLDIDFHPTAPARRVPVGGSAAFTHRIANRGTRALTLVLEVRRPGDTAPASVRELALAPGEVVEGETAFAPEHPGEQEVELTVRTDVSHAGRAHPARLTLHSWVRAVAPAVATDPRPPRRDLPYLDERDDRWVLGNRWLRLAVDRATGTCEIEPTRERGPAIRELWPDLGPPFPAALKTPPRRDVRCVRADVVDGRAELALEAAANVWWQRHGTAYAAARPDLGLARARLRRTLLLGGDQVVEVRTELIDAESELLSAVATGDCLLRVHPWARGRSLTMSVPLSEGVLRAPVVYERFPFGMHSLEMMGSADLPRDPGRYRERWTAFTDDDGRSVGLVWERAAQLRFGLQWMPSLLLAADPGAPDEGVARFPRYAFFCGPGDERAVREAWSAVTDPAEQVPVTARPPLSAPVPVHIALDPTAEVEPGAGAADGPGAVRLRGRLTVFSARARRGRLTAAVGDGPVRTLFEGDADGDAERSFTGRIELPPGPGGPLRVRLAWVEELARQRATCDVLPVARAAAPVSAVETGDVWVLGNGELTARIAPNFGGAVVGLRRDGGGELLRSTYPRTRPMGIVPRARGGIGVSTVAHRADPNTSVAREEFAWTPVRTATTGLRAAGLDWAGIRLTGNLDLAGSTVGLDIDYLMPAGAPLLMVLTHLRDDAGVFGPPPDICVAVHAAQDPPWFFRGLREGAEFEYHPAPHGSNRPIAGSSGIGALVPAAETGPTGPGLLLAAPPGAEVLGFRDGDDWSVRALVRAGSPAAGDAVTATCLAVLDAPRPVPAGVLATIAEAVRAAAAKAG
ncbi:hypothetical protein ACIBSV_39690 [Embleya sp. NPDC050154]|uniref:hypothetical protein n=1 Tax=Embleya sp. NPDC050154 TaxID=3363988 RepID=UPI0037AD2C8F